jgi:hypothetical protein
LRPQTGRGLIIVAHDAADAVLQGVQSCLTAAALSVELMCSGVIDAKLLVGGFWQNRSGVSCLLLFCPAGKGKALEFVLKELKEAGAFPPDGVQVGDLIS